MLIVVIDNDVRNPITGPENLRRTIGNCMSNRAQDSEGQYHQPDHNPQRIRRNVGQEERPERHRRKPCQRHRTRQPHAQVLTGPRHNHPHQHRDQPVHDHYPLLRLHEQQHHRAQPPARTRTQAFP